MKIAFTTICILANVAVMIACSQSPRNKVDNKKPSISDLQNESDLISNLSSWYGIYVNTEDTSSDYDSVISHYAWFRIKIISKDSIIYDNDKKMQNDFPTKAPGGYTIDIQCTYKFKKDTLLLYNKEIIKDPKFYGYKNIDDVPICAKLYKSDGKIFGYSSEIESTINLSNSARDCKIPPPYLFRKLNVSTNELQPSNTLFGGAKITVNNAPQYNEVAYQFEQTNLFQDAVDILEKIIQVAPDRVVAYLNLADAYWGLNKKEEAKQNYQKYIDLMKEQKKDLSRIPKIVYERIK